MGIFQSNSITLINFNLLQTNEQSVCHMAT